MKIFMSLLTLYILYHLYIMFFVLLPTIVLLILFIIIVNVGFWIYRFKHRNDYSCDEDRYQTEYMKRLMAGADMTYVEMLTYFSTLPEAGFQGRAWAEKKLIEMGVKRA